MFNAYAWKKEYYRKLKESNPSKFYEQQARYSKQYRESHKDNVREYKKNYLKKHPISKEKIKAYRKLFIDKKRKLLNRYCNFVKYISKCNLCFESNTSCLDFHHKNPQEKTASVSQYSSFGFSIKKIRTEIKKCVVLCSNCHRKQHYSATRHNNLSAY